MLCCVGNSMIKCTSAILKDYKKWEENTSECKNILFFFFKEASLEATIL